MAKAWDLRERTVDFAIAVYALCRTLPRTDETRDIVRQLRRSSSSVAANCRALRRSQSDKVFVVKAGTIIEEADESGFWLDFLVRTNAVPKQKTSALMGEADELVAIFTASRKTVRARLKAEKAARSAAGGRKKRVLSSKF